MKNTIILASTLAAFVLVGCDDKKAPTPAPAGGSSATKAAEGLTKDAAKAAEAVKGATDKAGEAAAGVKDKLVGEVSGLYDGAKKQVDELAKKVDGLPEIVKAPLQGQVKALQDQVAAAGAKLEELKKADSGSFAKIGDELKGLLTKITEGVKAVKLPG
jgi:FlaG/FlaF family flagellin (archaellin)